MVEYRCRYKLMKVTVFEKINRQTYNSRVNHPLQSFEWGEFRKSNGVKVVRFGIWEKEKLVSAFQVFFHPIPKTKFTIGYFPKGEKPSKTMIKAIKQAARDNNAIFVKFEPNQIYKTWKNQKGKIEANDYQEKKFDFEKLGLVKSAKTTFDPHTFVLNLKKKEEELLESFQGKTRYNLRLSQRKGVKVVEESTPAGLTIFTNLLFEETVKRQGFYLHNPEYFKKLWEKLAPAGIAKILLAKYKSNVLAAWMIFSWKKTLYYPYGASSNQFRNLMASNLICWEAIRLGKKLGCEQFDMWGSLPPEADSDHPWYGFHRFKLGYGGDLVEMVGSWDLVVNKFLYPLYNLAEKLRWKFLRLKKR
ncbi:peptidoglycan bridge formation glycyltransferase FemA/FemB family protein [Candidatus Shapirobacteria bacterium]|nr:peptidoglycan bridge formation glycyltransferase FemA/FemB family protein [Candidatus Shapirobacteria bacterium]